MSKEHYSRKTTLCHTSERETISEPCSEVQHSKRKGSESPLRPSVFPSVRSLIYSFFSLTLGMSLGRKH